MPPCKTPNTTELVMIMDVESILHMKEGLGETSYAQNSSLQVMIFHYMSTINPIFTFFFFKLPVLSSEEEYGGHEAFHNRLSISCLCL